MAEGASPEEPEPRRAGEAIQDALDFGAGPELDGLVGTWPRRVRRSHAMDLPTPETDPGLAAASGSCVAAVPGKS
ncbi:hypothetical protein GS416_10370 [Rhodococcus hoagii]|nr:hypothetical protein [Prescottella equi]